MDYLHDLNTFIPAAVTALAGLVVIMLSAWRVRINTIFSITVLFLIVALGFSVRDLFGPSGTSFYGMIAYGGTAAFGTFLVLAATLLCVLKICRASCSE